MSFQAYLDNIKAKTGKSPEDFKKIAKEKGLLGENTKAADIVTWLKQDFELGHGHAMAIYNVFKTEKAKTEAKTDPLEKHFKGAKEKWKPAFELLMKKLNTFGPDVKTHPVASYISLLRGEKKFGVVQITGERIDVGIKLKGRETSERFEAAGDWNSMMNFRVRINEEKEIDKELLSWLQAAYEVNGTKK